MNVKKMDKKIFTILCWILSLLSRPRNKGILASSLDREKTQIRLGINITDTGKREKNVT